MTRMLAAILMAVMLGCPPPPTSTGALVVKVRDPSIGGAVGSVTVSLLGTSLGAITSASGIAFFPKVAAGQQTVQVLLPGSCVTNRVVTVVTAAVTHVTIWTCDDVVQLQNAPSAEAVALLDLRAEAGGITTCLSDQLRQGVGILDVALNALPLSSCHGSVAVMSGDHALYFSNDIATLSWTPSLGDHLSVTLAPEPLAVPLVIVVVAKDLAEYDARVLLMGDQLADAEGTLLKDFTGLRLYATEAGGAVESRRATPAEAAIIGTGCGSVDAIKSSSSLYRAGRLHVFAVETATDHFGHPVGGTSCIVRGAPEIIFIAPEATKTQTLAHEIGHSLGLQRPIWGHTNGLKGFREDIQDQPLNVMDDGRALGDTYFSIGQVMRMTMSEESWLNLPSAADGTTSRRRQTVGVMPQSIPCGCPETVATADCPTLNTDIMWPGSLHGPSTDVVACGATIPLPISLTCGTTKLVTIVLTPSTPPMAVGSAIFVSLTPLIVTVEPGVNDSKEATLTPHANGIGQIRVFADGSPYTFPVTVSECS